MQQLGRYAILGEIARGGMGVVYRAHDPAIGRDVAIKVQTASASSETARKRFTREAQALARVEHPNVVRLHGFDVTPQGYPYMVMELVEGTSLEGRLALAGGLDPDDAIEALLTLCDAVAACHAAGVLHRDLKPANVLVTGDGTLKLADFGLVRETDPSLDRTQLTLQGRLMGSPGYWAPEQAAGELDRVDARTDVFGLGAILFALLTGRPPHEGATPADVFLAAETPKQPPSTLNPAIPPWLDAVVLRALSIDPERRYAGPVELGRALSAGAPVGPRGWTWAASLGLALTGIATASLLLATARSPQPASPPPASSPPVAEASPAQPGPEPSTEPPSNAGPSPEAREAFERARALADSRDLPRALEAVNEALRLEPGFAAALGLRGFVRGGFQDFQGAIEDCSESLRREPSADVYAWRAAARANLGDHDGAIADCTAALRTNPDLAKAYTNRASSYWAIGDHTRAVADYDQALRLAPDDARSYHGRGTCRSQLGDHPGAIEDFTQAIRIAPNRAQPYEARGFSRFKLGDLDGALRDLERAVALNPGDANLRRNLEAVRQKLAGD